MFCQLSNKDEYSSWRVLVLIQKYKNQSMEYKTIRAWTIYTVRTDMYKIYIV